MSTPGAFIWFDLMTADPAAAARFYGAVIGWTAAPAGPPGLNYTMLRAAEAGIGGIVAIAPDAGADQPRPQPGWLGYISTADVDAAAARITAAGGAIHHQPEDIPGIGRFAVAADPQGAVFILFHGMGAAPPPPPGGTLGHIGWHELTTSDQAAAFAFYAGLFGWTKTDAIDMGPMGTYQLFATGGPAVGGMLMRPAIPPHWLFYINVDAIDAAVARTTAAGGHLVNGPHPVPGGSWIAHCKDPEGALFAMVSPHRTPPP
jgi:predicted enzyme related to lactoylglutathione lyase